MATMNLRVGNDALTFQEVDNNFTNLNNESFYGGITFTSGVLKFEPIGSTGGGGSDPYPPIEFNLDNTYLNQSSATILRPGKFEVPDGSFIPNSTNWATPEAKIQILETENFLVNAIQANSYGNLPSSDSSYATFYGETDGHRTKHYNPSDVVFSTSGGTTLTINNLDTYSAYTRSTTTHMVWSTHGIEVFYNLMSNLPESIIGGTIRLVHDGSTEQYIIDDITYTENADGERETVVLDLTYKTGSGVSGGDEIHEINFYSFTWNGSIPSSTSAYHLRAPKAPLTPPLGASFGSLQNSALGVGRLMAVNAFFRPDGSDTTLRYADSDDILVGGVTTSTDLLKIKPQERTNSVSSTILEGSQNLADVGRHVLISAGDTHHSSGDHSGGTLELRSGANTHYADDNDDYFTESISSSGDITDNVNSLIKLKGQLLSSNSTTHSSVVINAGRNIKDDSNNRHGANIQFFLGGSTGTGTPGGLSIKLRDAPQSNQVSSDVKPTGSASVEPFKIDWDSSINDYVTTISNISTTIAKEPAYVSSHQETNTDPYDYDNDGFGFDSDDTAEGEDIIFTDGIPNTNMIDATVISSKAYSVNSHYNSVLFNPSGYSDPISRLAFIKGGFDENSRLGSTAIKSGDSIYLGNFWEKTANNKHVFAAGIRIDGGAVHLHSPDTQTPHSINGDLTTDGDVTMTSGDLAVTGTITATGDITAFSDKSIKENVEVIEDAVDKVQQINGYTFDRTDIETPRQTGVIAQEVLKVLPEAVGEKDGKHTVAYGNMVGLLIEAIKEQQGQIDSLKEELQSIKSINK